MTRDQGSVTSRGAIRNNISHRRRRRCRQDALSRLNNPRFRAADADLCCFCLATGAGGGYRGAAAVELMGSRHFSRHRSPPLRRPSVGRSVRRLYRVSYRRAVVIVELAYFQPGADLLSWSSSSLLASY